MMNNIASYESQHTQPLHTLQNILVYLKRTSGRMKRRSIGRSILPNELHLKIHETGGGIMQTPPASTTARRGYGFLSQQHITSENTSLWSWRLEL